MSPVNKELFELVKKAWEDHYDPNKPKYDEDGNEYYYDHSKPFTKLYPEKE